MAQNVEKTSANLIEAIKFVDNLNVIDYYWNLKEDCCVNSQFKAVNCSSEESSSSIGSASSSDLLDDDTSTYLSPETHLLPEFSEPIGSQFSMTKGLSRYYQGKARTFTSLSDVKCVQDLAKKQIPFVKRGHTTSLHSPKAIIISKKNTRNSASSLASSKCFSHPRTV